MFTTSGTILGTTTTFTAYDDFVNAQADLDGIAAGKESNAAWDVAPVINQAGGTITTDSTAEAGIGAAFTAWTGSNDKGLIETTGMGGATVTYGDMTAFQFQRMNER